MRTIRWAIAEGTIGVCGSIVLLIVAGPLWLVDRLRHR
jgi:hypothetical protein